MNYSESTYNWRATIIIIRVSAKRYGWDKQWCAKETVRRSIMSFVMALVCNIRNSLLFVFIFLRETKKIVILFIHEIKVKNGDCEKPIKSKYKEFECKKLE